MSIWLLSTWTLRASGFMAYSLVKGVLQGHRLGFGHLVVFLGGALLWRCQL